MDICGMSTLLFVLLLHVLQFISCFRSFVDSQVVYVTNSTRGNTDDGRQMFGHGFKQVVW